MREREERCDRCKYWEAGSGKHWEELHPDDRQGECHRYAPRVIPAAVSDIGRLVGRATWAVEEQANIKHDANCVLRASFAQIIDIFDWPLTDGCMWCGDFVEIKP
jgi:hypothetical protein